jgi:transcriptional regulator with XRE-family HTH domain
VAGSVYPGSGRTPQPSDGGRSVVVVDNRTEVREFLSTRRAKLTPDKAGVPLYGQRRRVPGLRREEVAQLAGLSTDYYTRLEKGNLRGASDSVLEAIARALQLDDAEHAHLFDLARAARDGAREPRRRPRAQQVRPSIQHFLDSMATSVATVANGRLDLVAVNPLGRAVFAPVLDAPERPANMARFCFLDERAREFYPDWTAIADTTVALLRTEAGRDPYNRALTDLIGELATRSDEFRTRWAAHDVRLHLTGAKRLHHAVVGDLDLVFNTMQLPADPGLTLAVYTAEPGSPTEEKLAMLASWAAPAARADADIEAVSPPRP